MCFVGYNDACRKDLRRRLKDGSLFSPLPALYVRRGYWEGLDERDRALHKIRGLQMLHQGWLFCGTSAALVHGLSVSQRLYEPIAIADEHGKRHLVGGAVCARHTIGEDRPVFKDGVLLTSPLRTCFDCARWLSFQDAIAILDSALRLKLVTKKDLVDYADSRTTGCRGVRKARAAADFADGRAQNGGESIARAAMWELGFAAPDLQTEVYEPVEGKKYYLDFSWRLPDGRLIVGELDGRQKYTDPTMSGEGGIDGPMRKERLRESRLTACCDAVVRFSTETVGDAYEFDRLLTKFGVQKDHRPLREVPPLPACLAEPETVPVPDVFEEVPLAAYGI